MDKFLGQEIHEEKRKDFLSDNCDAVEPIGYRRRFNAEELSQKKEELANLSILINDIEEEKKDKMNEFKERLKPLNNNKQLLLSDLKDKAEFVNEDCFKFIDYEAKEVGYYNKLGELVYSRSIMPQEMQKTVFSITRKTGTNE